MNAILLLLKAGHYRSFQRKPTSWGAGLIPTRSQCRAKTMPALPIDQMPITKVTPLIGDRKVESKQRRFLSPASVVVPQLDTVSACGCLFSACSLLHLLISLAKCLTPRVSNRRSFWRSNRNAPRNEDQRHKQQVHSLDPLLPNSGSGSDTTWYICDSV
jgi:hypothetical protein